MATFVPVAQLDEQGVVDPALDLARHIQLVNGGDPDSVSQIPDQKALDLALENLDKIFAQAGEKEKEKESVEGVLNVVCWLFQRVLENNTNQADAVTLAEKLLKKITSDTATHPVLRLKMLSTIYNILEGNGTARYNTFLAIVQYAAAAGKDSLSMVSPQFEQLDTMLAEWGSDASKTRAMFQVPTVIFSCTMYTESGADLARHGKTRPSSTRCSSTATLTERTSTASSSSPRTRATRSWSRRSRRRAQP
eukprot:3368166-Rhodomonas_salina.2